MATQVKDVFNEVLQSGVEDLAASLGRLAVIDIGRCTAFDGRFAEVASNKFEKGQQVIYGKVEIVQIGNSSGAFGAAPTVGSLILVFSPRVPVPDILKDQVQGYWYSAMGMKGICISLGMDADVTSGIDSNGDFFVAGPHYHVTATKTGFSFLSENEALQVTLMSDGTFGIVTTESRVTVSSSPDGIMYFEYKNTDGITIMLSEFHPNGTQVIKRISSKEIETYDDEELKWTIIETYSPNGGVEIQYFDPDGNVIRTATTTPDGESSSETGSGGHTNITVKTDAEGNVTIESKGGTEISFEKDAEVTIKGNVTIKVQGNVKIEAQGNADVKAQGNATIDSPQVKITGGNLTVNGTASPGAGGPFCGIPTCLFTGSPHVGNMVSGT